MQSNHFSHEKVSTVTVTFPYQIHIVLMRKVTCTPPSTNTTGNNANIQTQVQIVKSRPPPCIPQDKDKEQGFMSFYE